SRESSCAESASGKNNAASPRRKAASQSPSFTTIASLLWHANAAAVGAAGVRIATIGRVVDALHSLLARQPADAAAAGRILGQADAARVRNAAQAAAILTGAAMRVADEAATVHSERLDHMALTDLAVADRRARVANDVERANRVRIAAQRLLICGLFAARHSL